MKIHVIMRKYIPLISNLYFLIKPLNVDLPVRFTTEGLKIQASLGVWLGFIRISLNIYVYVKCIKRIALTVHAYALGVML